MVSVCMPFSKPIQPVSRPWDIRVSCQLSLFVASLSSKIYQNINLFICMCACVCLRVEKPFWNFPTQKWLRNVFCFLGVDGGNILYFRYYGMPYGGPAYCHGGVDTHASSWQYSLLHPPPLSKVWLGLCAICQAFEIAAPTIPGGFIYTTPLIN